MFATLLSSTLFFALAIQSATAEFSIDTPTLTQCQDVQFGWQDTGAGPYNLLVVPGDDPCSDVVADLGDHDGTSMTWKVNLAAGTKVMFSLEDNNGDEAWSGAMTVQGSDDSSCLPQASSSAASSSTASSSAASSSAAPTTLVVSANPTKAATTAAATTSSGSAVPVGAANAGFNPTSGAFSARQLSTPALVLGALGALVALA
ncbi:hypothetical protein GLOTRDRAFT_117502 [Gloeophyllum trabeum ATCC 11539]|uniref:Uncharacterized protein n=1 Tax=Gloeophyllum trabeum (strain ATCC 11539 / FP-39264 / Madison 617) TaxID=670483 RepID=S7PYR7_GLOTA|nr:uncharacterized protein GLOTRDRAFT_117502 [Gloeophyllum trabeum ATCC 11539]EPQ52796.1 hypothetical protein GLOTRDRAFT_117502 [Gloeophyllum trabeum ATCC 11539]